MALSCRTKRSRRYESSGTTRGIQMSKSPDWYAPAGYADSSCRQHADDRDAARRRDETVRPTTSRSPRSARARTRA